MTFYIYIMAIKSGKRVNLRDYCNNIKSNDLNNMSLAKSQSRQSSEVETTRDSVFATGTR